MQKSSENSTEQTLLYTCFASLYSEMDCKRTWIQCGNNSCGKWRVVRDEIAEKFSDKPWTCEMNEDCCYNNCTVAEEKLEVQRGKKVVVTKFPYEKGEIIMAKMAGYCLWPAFITPDPNCDEYFDAVLNDNDEQEEITHIHVEFFGQPRTHAWIRTGHAFSFSGSNKTTVKSKWRKSYDTAMEEALKSLPLTCEERLQTCAFQCPKANDTGEGTAISHDDVDTRNIEDEVKARFSDEFYCFNTENGVKVERIRSPVWCGKKVDLYEVFNAVKKNGGFTQVCRRNLWLTLWKDLTGNVQPFNKPSGHVLKQYYEKHLLDFELHLKMNKERESKERDNSHHKYTKMHSQNVPKKRGRSKKSAMTESSQSDSRHLSIENLGKSDLPKAKQQLATEKENAFVSKQNRKRKSNETQSSSLTLTSKKSSNIFPSRDIVIIGSTRHDELPLEETAVSLHAKLDKFTEETKRRESKPQKFISPFLTSNVEKHNEKSHEEQKNAEITFDQAVPQLQVNFEPEKDAACLIAPSVDELVHSSDFYNQNSGEKDFTQHSHTRDRSITPVDASLVPGCCYLNANVQESEEASQLKTGTLKDTSLKNLFSNLAFEYVPSSNPSSPQIVPTEDDFEEDCGISIERELEEMEKVVRNANCNHLKGLSVNKTSDNLTAQQEFEQKDHECFTDDIVKDAINTMIKLDEDISQLEDSMELDFANDDE